MANRVEDAPYGTPSAHHQKHDENVAELHDESNEEDSEGEFPPEDVKDEPAQGSRFSTRGPADPRSVSLQTVRRMEASRNQPQNNQSQSNSQTNPPKKTTVASRQVDAKRYAAK